VRDAEISAYGGDEARFFPAFRPQAVVDRRRMNDARKSGVGKQEQRQTVRAPGHGDAQPVGPITGQGLKVTPKAFDKRGRERL
jgi:hypothetical protein